MEKKDRAFEIDAFRGYAVIGMVIYHFLFDVRYIMALNVFAFQDEIYFNDIIRPSLTLTFVIVSGISSCFSKNNAKRAGKIFLVSILFSAAMAIASLVLDMKLYVFFNVLHLLALGTAIYALFQLCEKRYISSHSTDTDSAVLFARRALVIFAIAAAFLLFFDRLTGLYYGQVSGYWLLPLGILPKENISMGDYLPILPWLGFFFIGIVIGRTAYPERKSLFPDVPNRLRSIVRPLEFLGRHSLIIYLLHQPIILAVLYALRYLKVL